MAKKVIWTEGARQERKDILDFWKFHNRSDLYSIKLNSLLNQAVEHICRFPKTGRQTEIKGIRTIRVMDYLVVYEEIEKALYILSVWDARQNPERLKKRLE